MTNLTDLSAEDLSETLASGRASAREVMEATLARVDAVNGELNAIVALRDRDALLAEADAADASERKGWLHGIPIAVKELADVAGLPTTLGSPLFRGNIAAQDGIVAARQKAAGAIVFGKTNSPEFGLGSNTFNPVYGATKNPYNTALTCGGSSGGSAVGVAARIVSVADGSDMMGSLRNPAAWNKTRQSKN